MSSWTSPNHEVGRKELDDLVNKHFDGQSTIDILKLMSKGAVISPGMSVCLNTDIANFCSNRQVLVRDRMPRLFPTLVNFGELEREQSS